jgi:hypothetical protein
MVGAMIGVDLDTDTAEYAHLLAFNPRIRSCPHDGLIMFMHAFGWMFLKIRSFMTPERLAHCSLPTRISQYRSLHTLTLRI